MASDAHVPYDGRDIQLIDCAACEGVHALGQSTIHNGTVYHKTRTEAPK